MERRMVHVDRDHLAVTERVEDGYWQQRGYDRDAYIGGSNGR